MTRVIRDPIQRSKDQRSTSPGRLMPWPKISHILRTERPSNFVLGIQYDDPRHRHARVRWPPSWKLWVAVQVTTCRRQRHTVSAPPQAAQ